MANPLLLLGCAPQSKPCIHPHSHWVLALRVSPTHYTLYSLLPNTNTLSSRSVSSDEITQSVHPSSGCIVAYIPASETSSLEHALQSLTYPTPPSTPPPSTPHDDDDDDDCPCHARWPDTLRTLRTTINNDDITFLIRDEEEMRNEMEKRHGQWSSSTRSLSFIDWLASVMI
ncbi:uncharacterized protein STEHIDRAFT_126114 [Stereum hirsutum FP-91666 SS1]|uniref:Uncharacterized protein n=1 Tax=Stereum hirsutum (strain FP-91666) TaxID=721885 RepID=R7RXQ7_STEHR|nr:uncharacterized protein STEHIDRAFT_126114 [Stereum hirsutum FP-91666 SS1]EIM80119.1 hypothetical protein STEHIDRAFT_126114 [Stereum hirsutum FP-91666 SS1]